MPTSHLYQLNEILELIFYTNPSSLLDIGIGFGKYGFLSREYLELWDGREKYNDWTRSIDGIEAYEKYITPIHKLIYDNIYIGNALDIIPKLYKRYDLILIIDVMEHFTYEDGKHLLALCEEKGRNVIISTPRDIGIQENAFDNEFETHRFQWDKKYFSDIKNLFFIENEFSQILFYGEDVVKVKNIYDNMRLYRRKQSNKRRIKKVLPFLVGPYRTLKKMLKKNK